MVFGNMRLTKTFIKLFEKNSLKFPSPVGEKVVFESYAYRLGYFWHCKVDEVLKVSFCIFKILDFFEP